MVLEVIASYLLHQRKNADLNIFLNTIALFCFQDIWINIIKTTHTFCLDTNIYFQQSDIFHIHPKGTCKIPKGRGGKQKIIEQLI